jgi:hypothetical protein
MMEHMTWLLRHAARLLPPERRPWAEALQAETGQVPPGWPRLRWLAGGLVLVAREGHMARKIVYCLGLGAVAAAAAWVVILSWQQTQAADAENMTDRARILAGVVALLLLPWIGRRSGVFGPVGDSVAARLVRVAGCAAICDAGLVFVRIDGHSNVNDAIGSGTFSWPREIAGVVLIAALFLVPGLVRARWPRLDPVGFWSLTALAGVPALIVAPFQLIAVLLVAGVYALTSRRSRVTPATLTAGALAGLAGGGLIKELTIVMSGHLDSATVAFFLLPSMVVLPAGLAGLAAAWLRPDTGDPQALRQERIRQALIAGAMAGLVSGMVVTFVTQWFPMLIQGPVFGVAAGAIGGIWGAYHPRAPWPDRHRDMGLFVYKS